VDGEVRPPVFQEQQDMRRIVEVAAEHGIEIPPPIAEETGLRNATKTS
jgi:hypothetical protein